MAEKGQGGDGGGGARLSKRAAKLQRERERLAELEEVQATILAEAAPLVAPSGLLVYMTCSLFTAENEAQAARYIAAHPGWMLERDGVDTPLTASDGFYHAILRAPRA